MPTIKISTGIAQAIADSSGITGTATGSTGPVGMANTSTGYIRIMSGPIPTQNELELAYPTWDRFTGSPSEILIEAPNLSSYFDGNDGIVTWDLRTINATKSGVASWWIWSGYTSYNPPDRGTNPDSGGVIYLPCIVGDITLVGGGGSMTLADLNIVAGAEYEIGPASFPVPRTYSYV